MQCVITGLSDLRQLMIAQAPAARGASFHAAVELHALLPPGLLQRRMHMTRIYPGWHARMAWQWSAWHIASGSYDAFIIIVLHPFLQVMQ